MDRKPCTRCKGVGTELDQPITSKRLKRLRSGLTLTNVAATMGVAISYLSDLEHGRRNWTFDLVDRFEEAVIKLKSP